MNRETTCVKNRRKNRPRITPSSSSRASGKFILTLYGIYYNNIVSTAKTLKPEKRWSPYLLYSFFFLSFPSSRPPLISLRWLAPAVKSNIIIARGAIFSFFFFLLYIISLRVSAFLFIFVLFFLLESYIFLLYTCTACTPRVR